MAQFLVFDLALKVLINADAARVLACHCQGILRQ